MGCPQFDYRLGAVVDLDTSEYKYERPEMIDAKKLIVDTTDYETAMAHALKQAVVYGQGNLVVKPHDKRTDVQRKADQYYEEQERRLKKQRGES